MFNLSERQLNILRFIIAFINANEFPPTIREIGEQVGITSTSVVNYNLAKLEELNLIARRKEVSRGLSLNWERLEALKRVNSALAGLITSSGLAGSANGDRHNSNLLRVPILGAIAAGEPILAEAREPKNPEGWVELPESMLRNSDKLFALRVKGDSMIDASVLDGDVVVLRHQETANDGDMVAAWIAGDEETTLKYLYREGRNVRLEPANPAYQPIIREADKVRINGKVVSVIRVLEK
jgi:repressor LexA